MTTPIDVAELGASLAFERVTVAELRADLARVTADCERERKAAGMFADRAHEQAGKLSALRAQVRALQKVARAAERWARFSPALPSSGKQLRGALDALPPSMLEEPA